VERNRHRLTFADHQEFPPARHARAGSFSGLGSARVHGDNREAMPLSASVVLCTYNGARFLGAQWKSLLAQSRLPDEIVVRDDVSSDATPELLSSLATEAEKRKIVVRFTRGASNVGYVANFEAALRDASGDILFLCDQDDVWRFDKLATLIARFERCTGLLLLCSDARRIDAAGGELSRTLFDVLRVTRGELRRIHAGGGFEVLLRRSLATGATIALRRELLPDALPFPQGWVQDEWLAIIAAALGGFDCVEQPLIKYRQHGENQLGMRARGLAAKWADLVKPRPARIDRLIARDEALQERLQLLGSRVLQSSRNRTAEKLRHLRARGALHGRPWRRTAAILREAVSGRYGRYASGWKEAVRDLLRRAGT
jgi:hypothetical protein